MATPTAWGTEFLVNTITAYHQAAPSITALANGRFVATWEDYQSWTLGDNSLTAIHGQIFNADGSKAGAEFLVNTTTNGDQRAPHTVERQGDGFVVTWTDFSKGGIDVDIRAQVFGSDGAKMGGEFIVNTQTAGTQTGSTIAALADGRFVVAWVDTESGPNAPDIHAQVLASDGSKVGSEFLVNTSVLNAQTEPTVTGLVGGRFVIAWNDKITQQDSDIHAQIFNADGSKAGAEFAVNGAVTLDSEPSITSLVNGGFVVSWTKGTGGTSDIHAQVFNPNGTKFGSDFVVNTTTINGQYTSTLAALQDGRFVAAWTDDSHTGADSGNTAIRAQVFNPDGTKSGAEFLVNTTTASYQEEPSITVLADGRFVVSWTDESYAGGDHVSNDVRAQIFDPREKGVTLTGSDAGDDFVGTKFADTLIGGHGNDHLDGGAGIDTAMYSGASTDYRIDQLANGDLKVTDLRPGSPDGTDILRSIEKLSFNEGTFVAKDLISHAPPGVHWGGSPDLGSRGTDWHVAAVADFNGDGTSDILWQNVNTGQLDAWKIVNGQWAGSTDLGGRGADWQVVGTGDFNHDGTSDILWRNVNTGQLDEWTMANGNWSSSADLGNHGTDWKVAGIADFNGDGNSDILFRNSVTGQTDAWTMKNGNWAGSTDLGNHGVDWQVAGTGDFNHDGSADVLWHNSTTGQVDEWQLVNGQWAGSVSLGSYNTAWQVATVNDFNGDGTSDVMWRNPATGEVDGWIMDNGNWAGSVSVGSFDPAYQVAGSGDFNHSGTADVLWHNAMTGQTSEWLLVTV